MPYVQNIVTCDPHAAITHTSLITSTCTWCRNDFITNSKNIPQASVCFRTPDFPNRDNSGRSVQKPFPPARTITLCPISCATSNLSIARIPRRLSPRPPRAPPTLFSRHNSTLAVVCRSAVRLASARRLSTHGRDAETCTLPRQISRRGVCLHGASVHHMCTRCCMEVSQRVGECCRGSFSGGGADANAYSGATLFVV